MKKVINTPTPPLWGNDELSVFLQNTDYNARINAAKFPDIFTLLGRIYSAIHQVEEIIETDKRKEYLYVRVLTIRVHSSILAAIRLALSGQAPESYAVIRCAIEQAWYALHIAKDPFPPKRNEIWRSRDTDESSKSRCKSEFLIASVFSTHRSIDPATANRMHVLYETTIDFGAHPNPRGMLSTVKNATQPDEIGYQVDVLSSEPLPVTTALHEIVSTAICTLKVVDCIYSTKFKLMNFDREIDALSEHLNKAFTYVKSKPPVV